MKENFRIHGDNIIECERIIHLIKNNIEIIKEERKLISPAVIKYSLDFYFNKEKFSWIIELFPGFDKRNRARWGYNIFESLKERGSFLDETPDAILTRVENNEETVIMAIEFSSALNAGNQAWQRSGRAFSTAKIGSPYLYLDDFVRYELESASRKRKNLRFANSAVPYSYLNMGKSEGTFIVQAYIKSEEFDKNNPALENFDEYIFAEKEISDYIILSFSRQDTSSIEEVMLHKNLEMVKFLSPERNSLKAAKEFSKEDWEEIYTSNASVVEYSYKKGLNFKKIIQKKSLTQSSKTNLFNNLVTKYATGVASEGLPFGVIARNKRAEFTDKISNLYDLKEESLSFLKNDSTELLICIVKGFKPKGDDNRPDRGVLPFLTMLTSDKYEILSYIYGPMSKNSIDLFRNNFEQLAKQSGFWNVFLSMSDAILLDVPILKDTQDNTVAFQITQDFKNKQLSTLERSPIKFNKISIIPNSVHEDDVDSAIHTLFTSLPENICFESSCNPPGGDWSGISIRHNDYVYRWLSLPRAPKMVKRPDHILELSAGSKMYLLIIESKDYPNDILREGDLNKGLKDYLKRLIEFPPSAIYSEHDQKWKPNNDYDFLVSIENFQMISAAAYINKSNIDFSDRIFESSKCDMLFIFTPIQEEDDVHWKLNIMYSNSNGEYIYKLLLDNNLYDIAKKIGIEIL